MTQHCFQQTLDQHGLKLTRDETTTLQLNVGLTCDLACRHCHLEAGPNRTETMSRETMQAVISCAEQFRFTTVDITGGAPELLPQLPWLVEELAPLTPRLIVRTNLTALARPEAVGLLDIYKRHRVTIVASLPAVNAAQTDAQRGTGTWESNITTLRKLNGIGYGIDGSGLVLNLAANPTGAFLPPSQAQAERRFHQDLQRRYDISFSNLFTFANMPLGRFRTWLEKSGNLEGYLTKLADNFNPSTLTGLMCRSLISVNWDGYLFDCDFNLGLGLYYSQQRQHISTLTELPKPGSPIVIGDHCYSCTAGTGFTCCGSITSEDIP